MTLDQKLEKSKVLKTSRRTLKQLKILSGKQRILSLVVFILMAFYTIYTKIILGLKSFEILSLFIIFNLITLLILKIMSKNTIALNHQYLYRATIFINKLCKVVLFTVSLFDYYYYFNDYLLEHYSLSFADYILLLFGGSERVEVIFLEVLKKDIKLISFLFSIIVFIPTMLYFIFFVIKYYLLLFVMLLAASIPVLNIVFCLIWIFHNNNIFYYYSFDKEHNEVIVERRLIVSSSYKLTKILAKIVCSIPLVIWGFYILVQIFKS